MSQNHRSRGLIAAVVILVIFLVADSAALAYFISHNQKQQQDATQTTQETLAKTDSDSDGLSDAQEKAIKTNPYAKDTDNDGIDDADEVTAKSDPLVADSATTTPTTKPSTPTTASDTNCTTQNIVVTLPIADQVFTSPAKISGKAIAFEGTVSWRIKDATGSQLAKGTVTTVGDAAQCAPFESNITFPLPSTTNGTLEFYTVSAKDGSEQDLVSVPVKF